MALPATLSGSLQVGKQAAAQVPWPQQARGADNDAGRRGLGSAAAAACPTAPAADLGCALIHGLHDVMQFCSGGSRWGPACIARGSVPDTQL